MNTSNRRVYCLTDSFVSSYQKFIINIYGLAVKLGTFLQLVGMPMTVHVDSDLGLLYPSSQVVALPFQIQVLEKKQHPVAFRWGFFHWDTSCAAWMMSRDKALVYSSSSTMSSLSPFGKKRRIPRQARPYISRDWCGDLPDLDRIPLGYCIETTHQNDRLAWQIQARTPSH